MFIEFKEKVNRIIAGIEKDNNNYIFLPIQNKLNMICNCSGRCENTSIRCIYSNELIFDNSYLEVMEMFLGYKLTNIPEKNG